MPACTVDVWWIRLRPPAPADLALLSPAEAARAGAFRRPADRDRYVAAHAAVRRILAPLAGAAPAALRFESGPHGRPEVGAPATDLRFSLSRSAGLAGLAVARSVAVGIDVESRRPVEDALALAEMVLGDDVAAELRALAGDARSGAFLRRWTEHEARLKAAGLGLGATAPPLPVHPLHPPAGFVATLAVAAQGASVAERQFR